MLIPIEPDVPILESDGIPSAGREEGRVNTLTPRERAIVALICRGWSNQRIAEDLGLTVRTVKNRLTVIYHKVGVRTRVQLVVTMSKSDGSGT